MKKLVLDPPSEKQRAFLLDRHKYVAFGGARGGGKSWAVRTKAVLLCLKWPGIKVMIVRKTYPELQENHIMPLCTILNCYAPKGERIATYNDSKKHITFPNGSRILFRYCENDKDATRFQGMEADVLFVDEATQQSEDRIMQLKACVRGVNNFPKRIYYTCNPGGEGHGWVKRLFIDRNFKEDESPDDYHFIQSLVTDNKVLMKSDPDYISQLRSLPPHLRKMWLEGSWDIYQGQFFEEFQNKPDHYEDRRWTHVIEPFDIPVGWNIFRSYDFGYEKPFSCGWWAMDYDGVLYRILELYGCVQNSPNMGLKWNPDQQFAEIARIEREHPWLAGKQIIGVADPSIWDTSRGESIYEMALKHRVYFDKGDNKRIPGWMQVHYRMAFDSSGRSMLYVFNNCKGFIRTIPLLIYDEHRPEDLDTSMEDHIADETRYMCMARPIKPRLLPKKQVVFSDPLDQMTR